jgi:hypothetical protein
MSNKGLIGEALDVVVDMASEVTAAVNGAKQVGPAARLWQWLQTDRGIGATLARSAILTQAPRDLAAVLSDHWKSKGLAIKVVNRNPPQIPPQPPREKVRVPRG